MSEEFDDMEETDGIKSLRSANRKKDKEIEELRSQLSEFLKEKRTASLSEIMKAKGVPASAAKLYTSDEVSEEAVTRWLTEFSDVFSPQAVNEGESEVQRQADATNGGADKLFAPKNESTKPIFGDPEEILNALNNLPYDELVKLGYMPKG